MFCHSKEYMRILVNLCGKLKSLYNSRRENIDSLKDEIIEKDLEIGRQADLLGEYSSENLNYSGELLESEERINYLNAQVGDLEKSLEFQRNSAGHLKSGKKIAEKRFSSSKDFSLDLINRLVVEGYHPLEGIRNGRYAFIDRHGIMTSFSKKAQKIFGYEPGEAKYEDMISESAMKDLVNVKDEAVIERLPIRISEKEIILKNVRTEPIYFEDVYVGTLVDFEEIGRVEKLRAKWEERKEKKQEEESFKVKESIKTFLEDFRKKFGFESP